MARTLHPRDRGTGQQMATLMAVVAGPASQRLGSDVAAVLDVKPLAYECQRFPDGEAQVNLHESVRGRDVYVLQSTSPPVHQHVFELLLLADACRRAGAGRLTGVIPYFGYARQERRRDRQSLGARVAAQVISVGHFDRLMLVDAHTPSIEAFFDVPIDHLTAVPALAAAARHVAGRDSVVVAPDLGAVKLAHLYGRLLRLPVAVVHKERMSGDTVATHGVIGDVSGRTALVVDDMVSTGATIEGAVRGLRAAGAAEPYAVVATHALLVAGACERLARLPLTCLIAGDTIPIDRDAGAGLMIEVVSTAPLIAAAIRRHHFDESLADLRAST